jgi:hypothetical protein
MTQAISNSGADMATINQLGVVTSLTAADLLPLFSQTTGCDRAVSVGTLMAYLQTLISSAGMITQYAAPNATGFSVTIQLPDGGERLYLLLTPIADYATGTIVLPAVSGVVDGQEILVSSTHAVTTLTVSGNGAQVNGAPTALAANGFFRLVFDANYSSWFRIG